MLRPMTEIFYLIWIFIMFLCDVNSYQSHDIDADHVELTQLINNENQVRLRCDAKSSDAVESLILLSCPLTKTGVCRENCINPCPVNESSTICNEAVTLAIPKCIYRSMASDHIQIEYVIQLTAINEKGLWWCTFRGKRSNTVELDSYNSQQKVTTSSTNLLSNNIEIPKKYDSTTVDITTYVDISPNLVHLIIGLIGVSIAFNIFFFIRCFAVNNYLKNLHIGHPRNNCLDQLLCIDQPRKTMSATPKARLNYIQNMSPSETPKLMTKLSSVTATTTTTNVQQWESPDLMTMTMIKSNQSPTVYHKAKSNSSSPVVHSVSSHPYQRLQQQQQQLQQQQNLQPQFQKEAYLHQQYYSRNPMYAPMASHKAPSLEFIYDEVHNSVYTTLSSQPNDQEKMKQETKLTDSTFGAVYDGSHWLVDHSGQIYVPYAQITPKPRRILLSNVQYSTIKKSDMLTIPSPSNSMSETLTKRNHHIGYQTIANTRHLPVLPMQTEDGNFVNNNSIVPEFDYSTVPRNLLLVQTMPEEVPELNNIIEHSFQLPPTNHSAKQSTIMLTKQASSDKIESRSNQMESTTTDQEKDNNENTKQNSNNKINNTPNSNSFKHSIKLLVRKPIQPKVENIFSTHIQRKAGSCTLSVANKIADLEDWAMIDQD
ncbi:unnamed protein product [Heterobilharzia americana]|nr:unnamed protein product [Heterobilharzia americana]